MIDRPLCIHPELAQTKHERGVFEVEGHVGGWRQWLAYDSHGVIRINHGVHNRDVDAGLVGRLEARLDQMEENERREA